MFGKKICDLKLWAMDKFAYQSSLDRLNEKYWDLASKHEALMVHLGLEYEDMPATRGIKKKGSK